MPKIIVADTGPLIALALIDLLPFLPELFSNIYVPETVFSEATAEVSKPGAIQIQSAREKHWFKIEKVAMSQTFHDLIEVLDQGEAEALALAQQLDGIALIDERRGRRVALKHGIAITGSAAILIKARQIGFIDRVKPALEILRRHGYRMSDQLVAEVLRRVGE